jgi:hypothetical protein
MHFPVESSIVDSTASEIEELRISLRAWIMRGDNKNILILSKVSNFRTASFPLTTKVTRSNSLFGRNLELSSLCAKAKRVKR